MLTPQPVKTCQDYTDNNFTPYILHNVGVHEKKGCCIGRLFFKKKRGLASAEGCHHQLSSLKRKKKLKRSYHPWQLGEEYMSPSAIIPHPLQLDRFFSHTDGKKQELFEILISPLMERAGAVKQLHNTHSHSVLSSPSKSDDEG